MVLAVLVAEFELTGFFRLELAFLGIELLTGREESRATVIGALVNGEDGRVFPAIQGGATVWTPECGVVTWSAMRRKLREGVADFTEELGAFYAVVEVEVGGGRVAVGTARRSRDGGSVMVPLDSRQVLAGVLAILGKQRFPVGGRQALLRSRAFGEWRIGIDSVLAIVGMRLTESVSAKNVRAIMVEDFQDDNSCRE